MKADSSSQRGAAAAIVAHCHANLRSSPGPSTLTTQRAQSSGWRGSLPTSLRKCQQRTHFGCAARFDLDPHAFGLSLHRIGGRCIGFDDMRLAGDQQESQFVVQCRIAGRLPVRRENRHFGLERRADLARRSQSFQLSRHIRLKRDERRPIDVGAALRSGGKPVPGHSKTPIHCGRRVGSSRPPRR